MNRFLVALLGLIALLGAGCSSAPVVQRAATIAIEHVDAQTIQQHDESVVADVPAHIEVAPPVEKVLSDAPAADYFAIGPPSEASQGIELALAGQQRGPGYISRVPSWVLPSAGVDLDFVHNLGYQRGFGNGSYSASSLITTSRASSGTAADTSGNYYSFAANVPRITNQGLLVEEARTNSTHNNTTTGAVAGTPGTLPTNVSLSTQGTGIAVSSVALGTESGIPYMDLNFNFTATGSANAFLLLDTTSGIAATYGQTYTHSLFVKQVSGVFPTVAIAMRERTAGGATNVVTNSSGGVAVPGSGTALGSDRLQFSATLSGATTTSLVPTVEFTIVNTTVYNFTLRIGWPQLELNPLINSTVASAVVAAGGSGGTNGTGVSLTVTGGTCPTPPVLLGTISGNALTAITGVSNAGSCTTLPPSPATVTGNSLSGATVTLTPTNNAAQGFATSPIPTTNAAVARNTDIITLTKVPAFGTQASSYGSSVPLVPIGNTVTSGRVDIVSVSDGANTNYGPTLLRDNLNSGALTARYRAGGGSNLFLSSGVAQANGTAGKAATAFTVPASQAISGNGTAAITSSTSISPTSLSVVSLGSNGNNGEIGNMYIKDVALWPSTALPAAQLQAITSVAYPHP